MSNTVPAPDLTSMAPGLSEAIINLRDLKEEKAGLEEKLGVINRKLDELQRTTIPDMMIELGSGNIPIQSVSMRGVGTLYLRSDMYVNIPAAKREEAHDWLREHGHGGIVKDTVHPSSLKAWAKEQTSNGTVLPDDLFSITPYVMAVLNKR
jgi:hypothetical protein